MDSSSIPCMFWAFAIIGGVQGDVKFTPFKCDVSSPHQFFPDRENCAKFYQCEKGYLVHKDCAPGTLYNSLHQDDKCDSPHNVKCPPPKVDAVSSMDCEAGSPGLYSDPTSCFHFYVCNGDEAVRISCPEGMQFTLSAQECLMPIDSDCGVMGSDEIDENRKRSLGTEGPPEYTTFIPDDVTIVYIGPDPLTPAEA